MRVVPGTAYDSECGAGEIEQIGQPQANVRDEGESIPSSEGGIPVTRLRHAVRIRIANSSVRALAREIGMSPSGLHSFLGGTSPHYSTIRKLTTWYVREAHRSNAEQTRESLLAALRLLLRHLPEHLQRPATAEILQVIRHHSERARVPLPEDLRSLLIELSG